jgi:hypothetical protein
VGVPSPRRVVYFTATVSKTRRTRGAGDVSCLRRADHEHRGGTPFSSLAPGICRAHAASNCTDLRYTKSINQHPAVATLCTARAEPQTRMISIKRTSYKI